MEKPELISDSIVLQSRSDWEPEPGLFSLVLGTVGVQALAANVWWMMPKADAVIGAGGQSSPVRPSCVLGEVGRRVCCGSGRRLSSP